MKKLLCSIALLAAVVVANGQGRVAFANGSTTGITNALTGSLISGAGNFYFGLYVGPVGTLEENLQLNILATNTAIAGRLTGGNPAPLAAPFNDAGVPLVFQIRGWSAAGGLSYESALAAAAGNPAILVGRSILGQASSTAAPTGAAALFGTSGTLAHGFTLAPSVPEPSSIALGLLGLGAIALFRRRK